MAEAIEIEEAEAQDSDAALAILKYLDEGNLVDQLETAHDDTSDLLEDMNEAEHTMKEWLRKYRRAIKLSKLEPKSKSKTFPFEGASNIMLPFIIEAMLDFHSRTVPELVYAKDVVNTKIYGENNPEKDARAKRVSMYSNFQLSEGIETWRDEQDKLLLALPCVGTGFKNTFYDQDGQEVESELLLADEVIFNHDYKTFKEAPQYFIKRKYSRNEILGFIRGAEEWDFDAKVLDEDEDLFDFIEIHCWLDLDGDDLTEPYIATIHEETESMVSLVPNFDEDTITENDEGEIIRVERVRQLTQYRFLPDPEGGPMGLGWGILLGDMFDAINTNMNQLIDAGTLANLAGNSGIIDAQMAPSGRGNRQQSGPIEVKLGELTPLTTGGQRLDQSIVQFPYRGPNETLFSLMQYLVENVSRMTMAASNIDKNTQEAASMYLARLQQGLKVPNSIVMRVYESAKEEFKKIAALNYKHYSNSRYNRVLDEQQEFDMAEDFNPEDCDIRLVADPSQGSDMERAQRADAVLQEAKEDQSNTLNIRQAYLDWLEVLNAPDVEALAPEPSGEPDPMQQLMVANMQMEAENNQRKLVLDELKYRLDSQKAAMAAAKDMAELGLAGDYKEAEIAHKYAETFKLLWEIGMAGDDPSETVKGIEQKMIDRNTPSLPLPTPVDLPPLDGQPDTAQPAQGAQ